MFNLLEKKLTISSILGDCKWLVSKWIGVSGALPKKYHFQILVIPDNRGLTLLGGFPGGFVPSSLGKILPLLYLVERDSVRGKIFSSEGV